MTNLSLLAQRVLCISWLLGTVTVGCEPNTQPQCLLSRDATGAGSSRAIGSSVAQLRSLGSRPAESGVLRISLANIESSGLSGGKDTSDFVRDQLSRSMRLASGTDFAVAAEQRDPEGRLFVRLRQLHQQVRVDQGELVVQVDTDGSIGAVLGTVVPDLDIRTEPQLSGEAALERALHSLEARSNITTHAQPALWIARGDDGVMRLAYRSEIEYVGPQGFTLEEVFTDADTGAIISRSPRIHRALARSIYNGNDLCMPSKLTLPGSPMFSEGGASSDAAANTAYQNIGTTYHFLKSALGRDSYDNKGALLRATVHLKFDAGATCDTNSAFWLDAPYSQLVFGDGDGVTRYPTMNALDITAHEFAHAITSGTSALKYTWEPGALNEAFSDIFGATVEAWSASGGSATSGPVRINPNSDTWKFGEVTVVPGSMPQDALRVMNNPTLDGYSVDYYPERLLFPYDSGGVHGNNGIANLAFYLLSQGGRHPRGKTSAVVSGIGMQKALSIWYTANTTLFTSTTDFAAARIATAQAAKNLFGVCSAEWVNTQLSWDAVGVPGTWTPCDCQQEKEPNNILSQANVVTDPRGEVAGYIATRTDVDHFSVMLPAGKLLNVDLTVPTSLDYELYILDSAGGILDQSENPAGMPEHALTRNTSTVAKKRFIRVKSCAGSSATDQYRLKIGIS